MAQPNYTPIQLYRTATASAAPLAGNLTDGELAINTADGKLFYKDSSGTVRTIADVNATAGYFLGTSAAGASIRLYEDTDNGTNYVALKAADSIASNVTWTLPATDGTSGQVLATNGSGALSWASGGGAATPAALGTVYGATNTSGLTFLGYQAGNSNTASDNTAVGYQALYTNTTGGTNVAVGQGTLYSNTTGSNNCAVGAFNTLSSNTTGIQNSAFSRGALGSNTTGSENSAFGYQALLSNTTASGNTAFGYKALYTNSTGGGSTAIGKSAAYSWVGNVFGNGIVAVGANALYNATSGRFNTAVGEGAANAVTSAENVTAVGASAAVSATGNNNAAFGGLALYTVTTGTDNTGIGANAGRNTSSGTGITTGSNNTFIGSGAFPNAATDNNEIVIGANQGGKGSGTAFIGGSAYQGSNSSSWSTTSDQRLKKNIADNNVGLEKLTQIQVRNFEYRLPEEVDAELSPNDAVIKSGVQLGVIAQELQAVLPECVRQESSGVLTVDTGDLTWYLINAVKQLKAEIDQLKGN